MFGKMHDRVGPPIAQQRQQPVILAGHIDPDEADVPAADLLPDPCSDPDRLDRGQGPGFQFVVDVPPREIVDDGYLVPEGREVKRSGPAAEAVTTEDQDAHGRGALPSQICIRTAVFPQT